MAKRTRQGRDTIPGLGDRVRELRSARGWSQNDLAQRVGCWASQISAIEGGLRAPSLKLGLAIAEAFGILAEQLAGKK